MRSSRPGPPAATTPGPGLSTAVTGDCSIRSSLTFATQRDGASAIRSSPRPFSGGSSEICPGRTSTSTRPPTSTRSATTSGAARPARACACWSSSSNGSPQLTNADARELARHVGSKDARPVAEVDPAARPRRRPGEERDLRLPERQRSAGRGPRENDGEASARIGPGHARGSEYARAVSDPDYNPLIDRPREGTRQRHRHRVAAGRQPKRKRGAAQRLEMNVFLGKELVDEI